jgi:tRNA A-37 threonylcarbamoyl transferase component Bud32
MVESDTTSGDERVVDGRYRLVRPLGRGAMGAVYEAVRLVDGARVAVKLVHPHLSKNDVNAARFAREVRLTQELDHPGIIRTFDAGLDGDGSLFLVMELLEGQTLRDRIVSAQYTPAQAVWILTEVLRALAVAHRAGIVHRDLKPENIFLARTPEGHEVVKLLDFGIARELESVSVTRTETTVGTPSYMAPEQATSAKTVGPAADVWAVGVMLYRVLTGALPFTGDGPYEVVLRVCSTPHPPVLSVAPDADPVLAAIVERCLEKDYRTRPGDADALLTLLEPLVERPRGLSHVVAHAGAPVLPQRARPAASRERPLRSDTPLEAALASGALTPMAPASRAPWVWGLVLLAAGVTGAGLLLGLSSADPTPLDTAEPTAVVSPAGPAPSRVEVPTAAAPSAPAPAATPEPVAVESSAATPPRSPARAPGTAAPRPSERRARATAASVDGARLGATDVVPESGEEDAEVEIAREPAGSPPPPAPTAQAEAAAPELPPIVAAPSPSASTSPAPSASASASAAKPAAPTPSPSASASKKPKAPPFVSF